MIVQTKTKETNKMKILEILYATTCMLLIFVSFPVLIFTGNLTLAFIIGFSGIASLGYWLASDLFNS
jgi:hypothetical protein